MALPPAAAQPERSASPEAKRPRASAGPPCAAAGPCAGAVRRPLSRRSCALAMALASHPRAGADSPAGVVSADADLTRRVARAAFANTVYIAGGTKDISAIDLGDLLRPGAGGPAERSVRKFTGHSEPLAFVAPYGLGSIISGGIDKVLKLWCVESGREVVSLAGHVGGLTWGCPHAGGSVAVSCSVDSTVRTWDLGSGRCDRVLRGHTQPVNCVIGDAGGTQLIASASTDTTVRLWDPRASEGQCVRTLEGHTADVLSLSNCPERHAPLCIASAGADGFVKLWDLRAMSHRRTMSGHTLAVRKVVACEGLAEGGDGWSLVSASFDTDVRVWDPERGECARVLSGQEAWLSWLHVYEDSAVVVSSAMDGTVVAWHAPTGQQLFHLPRALMHSPVRSPHWTYGYAYELSLGSYVSWPHLGVDWSREYTLAAWFRTYTVQHREVGLVGAARWGNTTGDGAHETQYNGGIELRRPAGGASGGTLVFLAGSDFEGAARTMTASVVPFRWYHVTATFEPLGGGTAALYLDGRPAGRWSGVGVARADDSPLEVGRLELDMSDDTWAGLVDDVAVWNRSLAAAEVAELYSSSPDAQGLRRGLALLSRADSDTREHAVDCSGRGLLGTLQQGALLYSDYSTPVSYRADCMDAQGEATCTPLSRLSVCGDGAATGIEQCDGGPNCTATCQCTEGHEPWEWGCIEKGAWCHEAFDLQHYFMPGSQDCWHYPVEMGRFHSKGCTINDIDGAIRGTVLSYCSQYCSLERDNSTEYCFTLAGRFHAQYPF
eukprot:m51a1_g11981 putative serine threonine protein kinase with wd40 repeats (777) ;mRNA; f:861308-864290